MKLHMLNFRGHHEQQPDEVAEQLQLVEPENELEADLLAAALLPHPETVVDDEARPDYVFDYQVGRHLENGLYQLQVGARDASGKRWHVEIVAGMLVTSAHAATDRQHGFSPHWFISKALHFKPSHPRVEQRYSGHAFGRLEFDVSGVLPHQRLFHA